MAISHIGNNIFLGLSTDTKPTNIPTGSIFITTDTRRIYHWDGDSWEESAYSSTGGLDLKTVVKESGSVVGAGLGRAINLSVGADFDVTEDTGNDEYDIKIADDAIGTNHIQDSAITNPLVADSAITNAKVDAAAAISYSKLNLATSIVNADVNASAAIDESKLAAKQGTSTQSGNGTTTVFTIAHGFGSSPASVYVTTASDDACGTPKITKDATNITIAYALAPPSGSSNLVWYWRVS